MLLVLYLFNFISSLLFVIYFFMTNSMLFLRTKLLQSFMAKFKKIWFHFSLHTCVSEMSWDLQSRQSLICLCRRQPDINSEKELNNISRTANDTAWWFSYVHFICCQMPTCFYEQNVIMFCQSWVNNKICLNDLESFPSHTKNIVHEEEEHENYKFIEWVFLFEFLIVIFSATRACFYIISSAQAICKIIFY